MAKLSIKRESKREDHPVAVPDVDASDAPEEPRIETPAAAAKHREVVPNVQAEAQHASQAPEDIRDGQVATPNT